MWAPLPKLADELAKWPDLTMKPILENIKKLEEAGKQPVTPTEWQKRFEKTSGSENPYAPFGAGHLRHRLRAGRRRDAGDAMGPGPAGCRASEGGFGGRRR